MNDDKKKSSKSEAEENNERLANRSEEEESEDVFIPEELKSIISDSDIPQDKKQSILKALMRVSVLKSSAFSGPVPPPEILKGYNEVI